MNLIDNIIRGISIENILIQAINHIYTKGPISITDMEVLSYMAIYHPEIFNKHIDSILTYLAIFYKNPTANTLQDLVFQQYKEHIKDSHHITYTPVQASIASNISLCSRIELSILPGAQSDSFRYAFMFLCRSERILQRSLLPQAWYIILWKVVSSSFICSVSFLFM